MRERRALDRALARLLRPMLGYLPSRWPETLYLHVRERALAAGQSEVEYVGSVMREPERVAMLIDAATIGHTAAYRHPEQFDHLRTVLQELARRRPGPLRIWCAGCSTGEEAYSAADSAQAVGVDAAVLGTDVNPVAIAVARSGLLPQRSAVGAPLPPEWAERVPEALRRRVRFEVASLIAPRPALDAGPFDIIFCRNVLIYFRQEQVPRLLKRIAAELLADGHLIVSPAEGVLPLPAGLRRGPVPGWLSLDRESDAKEVAHRTRESSPPTPEHGAEVGHDSTSPVLPAAAVREDSAEDAARLLSAGRAAEAEQVLSRLLNKDPQHLEGWFLLGEALLARGERAQARAAFLRVTRCATPTGATPSVDAEALRRAAIRRANALGEPGMDE